MVGRLAVAVVVGLSFSAAAKSDHLWIEAKARKVSKQRSEIAKVARDAMPAVVAITTRGGSESGDESQKGLGSGFIIHPDGYILTSSHVIEDSVEIRVALAKGDGEEEDYPARVIGNDPHTDVALLKIDAPRKLPVLKLASAKNVEVADWVVCIGNPFGLAFTVTVGVVSYKGRTDVVPNGRTGYFDYLQTDAPINPGNSGGPILDLNGEVVAIANAVNVAGQGIGFAVPIDTAKAVLPQLYKNGKVERGWMGVTVQDLTPEVAEAFGEKSYSGVIVSEVAQGGPGDEAGLHVGDVIVGLGEAKVERAHKLRWSVSTRTVGSPLDLSVRRDGKTMHLKVTLREPPPENKASKTAPAVSSDGDSGTSTEPASLGLGATIVDPDPDARSRTGVVAPWGALVQKLSASSALASAGLAEGDVVLKVGSTEIDSGRQLVESLSKLASGELARLFVRRGKSTLPFVFRKP